MKATYYGIPEAPHERLVANRDYSRSLGLPMISRGAEKHERPLAIVGGGPSIKDHLESIRRFADVWAINGTCAYLREHGIASTFCSVDADKIVARWATGATKALVCARCDPVVFETLANADVRIFELLADDPLGMACGSSTLTCLFQCAIEDGYRSVFVYGCESSFPNGATHAYQQEDRKALLLVKCNGEHFLTAPDMYTQAREVSDLLRSPPFNGIFNECSGGLLRAMLLDEDHDITHANDEAKAGWNVQQEVAA